MPKALADRLLATAGDLEGGSPQQALTAALRARFGFQPLTDRKPAKPILLAGLPGAGKSSTLAKLAARAKVNGWAATAITCDLAKAGAIEQLATYAKALEIPAYRAKDAATLRSAVAKADANGVILIDTLGTNPLKAADLAQLRELARSGRRGDRAGDGGRRRCRRKRGAGGRLRRGRRDATRSPPRSTSRGATAASWRRRRPGDSRLPESAPRRRSHRASAHCAPTSSAV